MKDPPDPKQLRLPSKRTLQPRPSRRPPRHKTHEKFLKGPIPWCWLQAAAETGRRTKALHVAVAVWFLAGIGRSRTVRLPRTILRCMGVQRDAARRGLAALEAASLVSVTRPPGCAPIVTILDYPNG